MVRKGDCHSDISLVDGGRTVQRTWLHSMPDLCFGSTLTQLLGGQRRILNIAISMMIPK